MYAEKKVCVWRGQGSGERVWFGCKSMDLRPLQPPTYSRSTPTVRLIISKPSAISYQFSRSNHLTMDFDKAVQEQSTVQYNGGQESEISEDVHPHIEQGRAWFVCECVESQEFPGTLISIHKRTETVAGAPGIDARLRSAPTKSEGKVLPDGSTYVASAVQYTQGDDAQKAKLNVVNNDVNALIAKMTSIQATAMQILLSKGSVTLPGDSSPVVRLGTGQQPKDAYNNNPRLWEAVFRNTSIKLQSLGFVASSSQVQSFKWSGTTIGTAFITSVIRAAVIGMSGGAIETIAGAIMSRLGDDLQITYQATTSSSRTSALLPVYYYNELTGKFGAVIAVITVIMSKSTRDTTTACYSSSSVTTTYNSRAVTYRVSPDLLRKQIGDNQSAIDAGAEFFGNSVKAGKAAAAPKWLSG
ncbi:unnamed protein product [Chondrus crispus]|uniref:Uncharacterized protein n=1 Tax=Chondrus crispus TaxID=2769 RepID=R7QJI7_CHOCR|nr:unnamed protein product [Chondrus crispus]CDF38264.1 unnamed protein product [Chondrus crispus]|eukprot:XP_005718149.1 unnamed protein product [Chondrus crispus]